VWTDGCEKEGELRAEEDARRGGDGSSIGVMELGPEFLGREELGLSGLCTSLLGAMPKRGWSLVWGS